MKYVKLIFRLIIGMFAGNFGVVEKGKVYRSAQAWHVYAIWPLLKLKTVINLSHKPHKDLHDRFEEWFCKRLGIRYVSYDTIGPGYNFDEAYIELCHCERPVLLHCEGGKDRSGGLVAYYKLKVLKRSYYEIINDWMVHWVPGDDWLRFLIDELWD